MTLIFRKKILILILSAVCLVGKLEPNAEPRDTQRNVYSLYWFCYYGAKVNTGNVRRKPSRSRKGRKYTRQREECLSQYKELLVTEISVEVWTRRAYLHFYEWSSEGWSDSRAACNSWLSVSVTDWGWYHELKLALVSQSHTESFPNL